MTETFPPAPPNYEGKHAEIRRRRAISPLSWLAMKEFKGRMGKMMTEVQDRHDEKVVLAKREGRELIQNDGGTTFIVHSTTPERAKDIIQNGLRFMGKYGAPEVPDLRHTGIMLADNTERMATERNIHNLAYRYGDEHSSVKLVYEFDTPNPHTSQNDDPFQGTFLEHADGVNVQQVSTEGDGTYLIPPERLKGYFDLQNEQFVPNPHFIPPVSSGHLATSALRHDNLS